MVKILLNSALVGILSVYARYAPSAGIEAGIDLDNTGAGAGTDAGILPDAGLQAGLSASTGLNTHASIAHGNAGDAGINDRDQLSNISGVIAGNLDINSGAKPAINVNDSVTKSKFNNLSQPSGNNRSIITLNVELTASDKAEIAELAKISSCANHRSVLLGVALTSQSLFNYADHDGNGIVDRNEYTNFLVEIGWSDQDVKEMGVGIKYNGYLEAENQEWSEDKYGILDTNALSVVDFAKIALARGVNFCEYLKGPIRMMDQIFYMLARGQKDSNGQGIIKDASFVGDNVFKMFDRDFNGIVTHEEFITKSVFGDNSWEDGLLYNEIIKKLGKRYG